MEKHKQMLAPPFILRFLTPHFAIRLCKYAPGRAGGWVIGSADRKMGQRFEAMSKIIYLPWLTISFFGPLHLESFGPFGPEIPTKSKRGSPRLSAPGSKKVEEKVERRSETSQKQPFLSSFSTFLRPFFSSFWPRG